MPVLCRHVFVSGSVQGVAFRWYTQERALELGVLGWVRNLDDGRVEVWIEGEPEPIEEMLAWLQRGPRSAQVRGLDVAVREPEGCPTFEIRGGAYA